MAGNVKEGSLPSTWEKYYAHEARQARNSHNALPQKTTPIKEVVFCFADDRHDNLQINYVMNAPFSSSGEIGTKKSPALPKGTF